MLWRAKSLRLGYQIEDRFEHGKDNGFGIAGIQESTLEKYSRRSAQRDEAIAKVHRTQWPQAVE